MKDESLEKWNNHYKRINASSINHDNWLQGHSSLFLPHENILELGCGFGANSMYLSGLGHDVLATDYSNEVLKKFSIANPGIPTRNMNILDVSDLPANMYDSVVADLCLHYFSEEELQTILTGLHRVLRDDGKLFFRLNSSSNHKAGTIAGDNYYFNDGIHRMFFTEAMIRDIWGNWDMLSIKSYNINRHGDEVKNLFEVVCRNYVRI